MLLSWSGAIINWFIRKRIDQMAEVMKNPSATQESVFHYLISNAAQTQWGQEFNYTSIKDYKTFRETVPVSTYEELHPFLEKVRKGESDVLWPGKINWFAKSSGTTSGKSKFIPVSDESITDCHFKSGKDLLALYCNYFENKEVFGGKTLVLGGSHELNEFDQNIIQGDLSAIMIENLPFWVQKRRSPSKSVALMGEWEEKLNKMAEEAITEDIRSISGVPSWTSVLIRKVLDITGANSLVEVWPNLELYMHGGVNFAPYVEEFKKYMPEDLQYLETYNASEGFFGIQDRPERDDLLLLLDYGIFYEFIPMSEFKMGSRNAIPLDDIDLGVEYAIVISTNSGLWRYLIGDTVIFTTNEPYRIKVTGRTKQYINVFGEELIVQNAEQAIMEVCKDTQAIVREFTAAPLLLNDGACGKHQWLVEFEKMPKDKSQFSALLDKKLQTLNSDYEAKRYKDLVLQQLDITYAKPNLFYQWLKGKGKLGGQNKVPRLVNDRSYMDELLALNSCD